MLELRNPHSILAAFQVRPRAVKSVTIPSHTSAAVWEDVILQAQRNSVPVLAGEQGGRQGGGRRQRRGSPKDRGSERSSAAFALVEPPSPVPYPQLLDATGSGDPAIFLALDQVQDPQNVGAIFRLAGFFGVRGVVMMKDRSASLTAVACDVAAGGAEHVPFSVIPNLAQAIQKAQEQDIFVIGTCERSSETLGSVPMTGHSMLVVGNEGTGLRRLTRERCDALVAMKPIGPVPSLNVAAATAACLAVMTNA